MTFISRHDHIQGRKLHYLIGQPSDLPLIAFFHGASKRTQNTEFWSPVFDLLTQISIPVFIDRYGFGKSQGNCSFTQEINDYTDLLLSVMKEYGKTSIYIVGRSAGAVYTLNILDMNRLNIAGIGLVAPASMVKYAEKLRNFHGKICVLWDQRDPVIGFDNYSVFEENKLTHQLFTIGSDGNKSYKHLDAEGIPASHMPELHGPKLFKDFISNLVSN